MTLYNQIGTFDLPGGFTVTLDRFNPFLASEGDTSVPLTLPPTPNNLRLTGFICRPDAFSASMVQAKAWLSLGVITIEGTLVIDTVSESDGIDAVFAFRNGSLYADYSDKPLKELFGGLTEIFNSPADAALHLDSIYNGSTEPNEYTCFPVMGCKGKDDGSRFVINEVDEHGSLVSQERELYENGQYLHVPEGYGITPFIYLHHLVNKMFTLMGYTVLENLFDSLPNKIVVLNNCVDTIVNGQIHYADLVPDMTVGEFFTWLRDRFMAQPVVNADTKTVSVTNFSTVTAASAASDITDILVGSVTMRYEKPSRVVITPSVAEGAEPAESSILALKNRYGGWMELNEAEFRSVLQNDNPVCHDCLVMRRSTGMFYELRRSIAKGDMVAHPIGTNYFAYDRGNTDQSEQFSPTDVMPLMHCGDNADVYPVIGELIHNHSAFNGMQSNTSQNLIIVSEVVSPLAAFKRCGTTQDYIPSPGQGNVGIPVGCALTPEALYSTYWSTYNNILLNGRRTATVRADFGVKVFAEASTTPMLCHNQKLIPVKMSITTGRKASPAEADFIVYHDNPTIHDSPIVPDTVPRLRWTLATSSAEEYAGIVNDHNNFMNTSHFYDIDWNEVEEDDPSVYWTAPPGTLKVISMDFNGIDREVFLGIPSESGLHVEFSVTLTRVIEATCHHIEQITMAQGQVHSVVTATEIKEFTFTDFFNMTFISKSY